MFDGHGEFGHHVSKYCRERIQRIWLDHSQNMRSAFLDIQREMEGNQGLDVRSSGATAVMMILRKGSLQIGNCGDSRAVLCRSVNGEASPLALTNDHKPDRPDERRRVQAAGGQVGSRQIIVGHNANGPVMLPLGPPRVWYQARGETMGLAMSRSLGDAIVHTSGVSSEPEMSEHAVGPYDLFVIMATDGIWDVIESNHAVQIVAAHLTRATGGLGNAGPWDVADAATVRVCVQCVHVRRKTRVCIESVCPSAEQGAWLCVLWCAVAGDDGTAAMGVSVADGG